LSWTSWRLRQWALLLENTTISEKQEKQIVIINGVLSTRDKTKKIVNTISK
jgi:hypothetical protein